MPEFLLNTFLTALSTFFFLGWGREQAERQIDKMQEAAFNTPGAEAPVPPKVAVAGASLLSGQWLLNRKVFGLNGWRSMSSFLLGLVAGAGLFLLKLQRGPRG